MQRLRMTIVLEYDADPDWYDTKDIQEMAKVDEENMVNDDAFLYRFVEDILLIESTQLNIECVPILSKGDNNVKDVI